MDGQPLVGARPGAARADDVVVQSVPADEGFWVASGAGRRVWVPMDHYTPDLRRWYVGEFKLKGGGWRLAGERQFRDAGAFLLVRPGG